MPKSEQDPGLPSQSSVCLPQWQAQRDKRGKGGREKVRKRE